MSLNQIVLVNLTIIVTGMSMAAYNWDKNRRLRWSPIGATLVAGVVYLAFGRNPLTATFVTKIMAMSLVVGFLFYSVIWIECSEWAKRKSDRQ